MQGGRKQRIGPVLAMFAFFGVDSCLTGQVESEPNQPVRRIKLEEMQFADKSVADKVQRMHTAAEKMAQPGWKHKPFESFTNFSARGVYYSHWYTFAEADDRWPPVNYIGPKELNCCSLGVFFDADKNDPATHLKIVGTTLHAQWKPRLEGWAASMSYTTFLGKPSPRSGKPAEQFQCRFTHYGTAGSTKKRLPSIHFYLHNFSYFIEDFVFGANETPFPTRYSIILRTFAADELGAIRPDKELVQVLESAESLRDYLVDSNTMLLRRADEEMKNGKAVVSARYERRDGDIPFKSDNVPKSSNRKLADEEKQLILKAVKKEVDARIATAKEQYKEMHAAALKAFPIRECLLEKAAGSH